MRADDIIMGAFLMRERPGPFPEGGETSGQVSAFDGSADKSRRTHSAASASSATSAPTSTSAPALEEVHG